MYDQEVYHIDTVSEPHKSTVKPRALCRDSGDTVNKSFVKTGGLIEPRKSRVIQLETLHDCCQNVFRSDRPEFKAALLFLGHQIIKFISLFFFSISLQIKTRV